MTLSISQTVTAVGPNIPASFLANGGTAPYVYAVLSGGAGGSINPSTGEYTAPSVINPEPEQDFDTIEVTDSLAATATAQIQVGSPLILFCEIIQRELGLANGRVYIWDQKLNQPRDSDLYVAVSVPVCKPFANVNRQVSGGVGVLDAKAYVAMLAVLDIDIISRGPAARDRKEEVILALNSVYAQQQQEINSFYVGKLPPGHGFINLNEVDGAAIPYRYRISVNIQYAVSKSTPVEFFDDFELEETIDP